VDNVNQATNNQTTTNEQQATEPSTMDKVQAQASNLVTTAKENPQHTTNILLGLLTLTSILD